MTRVVRLSVLAWIAGGALALSAASGEAKSYAADRFLVTATLLPDRSMSVEERIVFRFESGEFTYVFREIPRDRTDAIADIVAALDDVPFADGTGPGTLEVKRDGGVRVTWHFAPTTGVHTFTLRYRLLGVVARDGADDVFAWHVLPRQHAYPIAEAEAVVHLPRNVRLRAMPSLSPASSAVGVDYGADGQVTERIRVSARNLGRNASMTLGLRLAAGGFTGDVPAWQRGAAERARRGPWLLAVAAIVLVLGFGWLAAFWSAWRRSLADGPAPPARGTPPDPHLPLAFAARLGGSPAPQAATMVDLAARGIIAISEAGTGRRLAGRKYVATLLQEATGLRAHETAWLDVAFGSETPRSREVPLDKLQRRFARGRTAYSRALEEEMQRAGLVDLERVGASKTLIRAALAVLFLALASVAVALLLGPSFGAWAAVVPVSVGLVAAGCGIAAGTFSTFSREGERQARAWKSYFHEIRRLAKDKGSKAPSIAAEWLPFAIAAGVGAAWARKLAAAPGQSAPPGWFHAAAVEDHHAAFVAFLGTHTSTSSHGANGAGGGGAAAGGGSSGAG